MPLENSEISFSVTLALRNSLGADIYISEKLDLLQEIIILNVNCDENYMKKYELAHKSRAALRLWLLDSKVLLKNGFHVNASDILKDEVPLELIAKLTESRIMSFYSYIDRLSGNAEKLAAFSRTMADGFFEDFYEKKLVLGQILCEMLLILEVFDDVVASNCKLILDTICRKWWTKITSGEVGLNPCLVMLQHPVIVKKSLKRLFRRIIKYLLTLTPDIKIVNAFVEQSSWNFFYVQPLVAETLISLMIPFESEEILCVLNEILEAQEINWRNVLVSFSAFLLRFSNSSSLLKEQISKWLVDSLQESKEDWLLTAFLVARQAGGEGQHLFPSYQRWFSETFGDLSTSPASSGRKFVFLVDTLLSLIQHESLPTLKIHVSNPPAVPPGMEYKLSEFLKRHKERINFLDEAFDTTPFSKQSKVDVDIKLAVESYEKTEKIPNTLIEASIFRINYYQGSFLPALLSPRIIPDNGDARERLIDVLKSISKISPSQYSAYKDACKKYASEFARGLFEEEDEEDLFM
ncbi:Fanconi anemia group A protein homolog [Artemia franciscana]|uniref:Fanconi anemia group A protein homolog n=1 Tax=Artemia franciscana TaxID=6661 RepID=UPI0032DB7DD2